MSPILTRVFSPAHDLDLDSPVFKFIICALLGKNPPDRVKALLGKLKSLRCGKDRGYTPSEELTHTSHKFVRRVENIFANLPKPMEW